MNINIDVHLNIEGTRSVQGGPFEVNPKEFKEEPEFTAAVVAYQFIEQIKRETGQRETIIEKVTYDGDNDITEIVKQIRPVVDDSWLPF